MSASQDDSREQNHSQKDNEDIKIQDEFYLHVAHTTRVFLMPIKHTKRKERALIVLLSPYCILKR